MKLLKISGLAAMAILMIAVAPGCNKSLQQRIEQAKGASEGEEFRAKEKAEQDVQNEYQDEWSAFRTDAEQQISDNQKSIEKIQTKIAAADEQTKSRMQSALDIAARKNEDLKKRMDAYKDDGKVNWDAFKRDATHDLDALGNSLKDLAVQSNK